jgi:alpha-maltose-1-phosphate synthase
MKIALLTNEFPPQVYGGAGVHVGHLVREMSRLREDRLTLEILYFGDQNQESSNVYVRGVQTDFKFSAADPRHLQLFQTLLKNLVMAGSLDRVDLVHCHTWYTHLGGCLLKQLLGVPLVLTTHSLEPQRPWKADQLGSGYRVSTWIEKTAYQNADGIIAVSGEMASAVVDIYGVSPERVRIIPNGIDSDEFKPTFNPEILISYGIEPAEPYILFVGRITRQKGWTHLLDAAPHLLPGTQLVLCAASADTETVTRALQTQLEELRTSGAGPVIWIPRMVPQEHLVCLYTQAAAFVCPSIYEPFGIINLEAMACETPVVASAVGGIKEVVIHEETGLLVPFEPRNSCDPRPRDPHQFSLDLAQAINRLLSDPATAGKMGESGRRRVEQVFSWKSVARQTLDCYETLIT